MKSAREQEIWKEKKNCFIISEAPITLAICPDIDMIY